MSSLSGANFGAIQMAVCGSMELLSCICTCQALVLTFID